MSEELANNIFHILWINDWEQILYMIVQQKIVPYLDSCSIAGVSQECQDCKECHPWQAWHWTLDQAPRDTVIKRRQHGSSSTGGINYRFVLYTSLLISYVQQKCINPFDIRWEKLCRWVRFISWDVGCNLHFDTKCAMHLIYVITTLKIMRGCSCSQQHALLMPWISWTINTKPRKNAPYTLTPFAHGKKVF